MVAMKFMKERAQFLREVRVRAQGNFSEVHVMGGIRVHDCDEDPDFRDEAVAKGFVDFPYCFVMHVGERNLGDVMVKEHLAGRDWGQIRMITWQIASAVGHMHHNGFIHGDLKRKLESRYSNMQTRKCAISFSLYEIYPPCFFSPTHYPPTFSFAFCSSLLLIFFTICGILA